jgi:hypothetical protein
MRGDPQVVAGRLPSVAPSRRWRLSSWTAQRIQERRRRRGERLEVIERLAREERRARQRGLYVPEAKYRIRVRPW